MLKNYLSLIKFSHTIFALPFAIIGFFLAIYVMDYEWSWKIFGLVILCMVFARSAAMSFNRYADQDIDKKNPRTAQREIPAGILSSNSVLVFIIINSLLFVTTAFFINRICFFLSPVALAIILGYSYTKRFTSLSHFILGLGLSLAPIGAWLAITEKFDWLPIFYSLTVLFWVGGFDIIYGLQDEQFDKKHKLYSMPVRIGKKNALALSTFLHILSAGFILFAGYYAQLGIWYWMGSGIFIGLLIYQHTLIKPNDLSKVNLAFFTTNGIASILFAIFVVIDLMV